MKISKKILIVDDRGELRKLVAMTLGHRDYEFAEAANGRTAVTLAAMFNPDLVILDVMMPGEMDGFEVCRALRANRAFRQLKVLMLTARGQAQDREVGKSAGADAYVVKPFSPLALIRTVDQLLADEAPLQRRVNHA